MRKVLLIIPLFLFAAGVLAAQTAEQGAVLGVVTDQSGAVVPGAKVTVWVATNRPLSSSGLRSEAVLAPSRMVPSGASSLPS